MIKRTKEEIEKFIKDNLECKVTIYENEYDKVELLIYQMYEYVELNSDRLFALAEFFGTYNIDAYDKDSYGGCETCDYGSKYEYTLLIQPEVTEVVTDNPKLDKLTRELRNF